MADLAQLASDMWIVAVFFILCVVVPIQHGFFILLIGVCVTVLDLLTLADEIDIESERNLELQRQLDMLKEEHIALFDKVKKLSETIRKNDGFGSTGR